MEVAKRLAFEDLSASLMVNRPLERGTAGLTGPDFFMQLKALASDVQTADAALKQRLQGHRNAALQQLEETGGKQALESHLKAQKANWKFLGQKEAFLHHVQQFQDSAALLKHDFQVDITLADDAVKAYKDDMKCRQNSIAKVEQQMQGIIDQIVRLYDQGKASTQKLALQLPAVVKDLEEYQASRPAIPSITVNGMSEAEMQRLIAAEEARAAQLEQQAAEQAASWAEEDAKYNALAARLHVLEAELAEVRSARASQAQHQGAKYHQQLQWYETLVPAVSRLNGVELTAQDGNSLRLTLTQHVPRGMLEAAEGAAGASSVAGAGCSSPASQLRFACSKAGDEQVVEHVLMLDFEPGVGCYLLRNAVLAPPAVDIQQEVVAARAAQQENSSTSMAALSGFILEVKAKIRHHCRRHLLLEDAHERYPLQETNVSPDLLRCVLPNRYEAEVLVPQAWPDTPGVTLQLVQLQAPTASMDLSATLARIQRALEQPPALLKDCSLRQLLDFVCDQIPQGAPA